MVGHLPACTPAGKTGQLLGGRIDLPVLPASPCWGLFWSGGHCLSMAWSSPLPPGMQHRIGALLHRLSTKLSRHWPQQGEQFGRLASHVLVGPTRRLAFWLPGGARLREALVGTTLVLTPQLQTKLLGRHIGPLNHRFFAEGKWLCHFLPIQSVSLMSQPLIVRHLVEKGEMGWQPRRVL